MFILDSRKPTYCDEYAKTSCQMECESGSPTAMRKFSLGLSRMKLRRSPSNASQATMSEKCSATCRQIEIDFVSHIACHVRVTAVNGEVSQDMDVSANADDARFVPVMPGCGHGMWKIEVFDDKMELQFTDHICIVGVGSLHYEIADDYEPYLADKEWLDLPAASLCCY